MCEMAQLELRLLGGFQAAVADTPITQFRTDKMRALLAYLALNSERPFRRDILATLLWPDWPDDAARRNLRQTLHRLRQLLDKIEAGLGDELFTTTRQTVQLNQTAVLLDVQQFHQHLAACNDHPHTSLATCTHCLTEMRQAAQLYQGDLLDGFSLKDALPFEEWLVIQREQQQQLALDLLSKLTNGLTEANALADAQAIAAQQLNIAPWRESAHRQLMRLFMQQGQRSKALAQYESCRDLLMQELGVEPSAETDGLYQQIKNGTFEETAVSPTAPLHGFPTRLTPFIGRQQMLTEIVEQLADPTCRLLTLLGPGGIGKTRLCIEIGQAAQHNSAYRDGIHFIPLVAVSDTARLIGVIAQQLGIQLSEKEPTQAQLMAHLQSKQMLLICDNFEQILAGAPLLNEIVTAAPHVQLLVTSREPLNLQSEWRYTVTGLDDSQGAKSEAVRFFEQSARRVFPRFQLDDEAVTAVLTLSQLVDGLPLALELAAAWTRMMDCATILHETEKSIDFLTSPLGDVPARHQSIRAVLNQSWQLLSEPLQHTLAQLAYFAGEFSLEAMQTVVPGVSMLDLAKLLDRSLLRWDVNGRYSIHELLRQFATEQIAPTNTVQQNHSYTYLQLAAKNETALRGSNSPIALATMRQALDNIRLGWETAVSQQMWLLLLESVEGLFNYYVISGYLFEFDQLLTETEAHPTAAAMPHALQGALLEKQSLIAIWQGRYKEVEHLVTALHTLATTHQNAELSIRANLLQCEKQYLQGELENSLPALEAALAFFMEKNDTRMQAQIKNQLGWVNYQLGHLDKALHHHQDALALNKSHDDQIAISTCFIDIGNAYTLKGELKQALSSFEDARIISERLNYRRGIARAFHSTGRVYLAQSKDQEALTAFEEALRIMQRLGEQRTTSLCYNTIGIVYKRQEQYDKALTYYQKALKINRSLNLQDEIVHNLNNFGNIYAAQQKFSEAEEAFLEAAAIADKLNYREGIASTSGNLAGLYRKQERWEEAVETYSRAIAQARKFDGKYILAITLLYHGESLIGLSKLREAADSIKEGRQFAEQLESSDLIDIATELQERLATAQAA